METKLGGCRFWEPEGGNDQLRKILLTCRTRRRLSPDRLLSVMEVAKVLGDVDKSSFLEMGRPAGVGSREAGKREIGNSDCTRFFQGVLLQRKEGRSWKVK